MPKKTAKKYFIKGKEEITDSQAPVVSNEFIDKRAEGEYRGQTIEVHSDTHLEDDLGTGDPYILRTFTFAVNPELVKTGLPDTQTIFSMNMRGIEAILWGDGLLAVKELAPQVLISRNRKYAFIQVWARPKMGETLLETPKTLSQIINGSKSNPNKV